MKSEDPKFNVGDLVEFKEEFIGSMVEGLGIIVSAPVLVFEHDWPTNYGYEDKIWSYDVKVGSNLFRMIPEDFLRGLKDEDEEDSE